MIFLDYLTHGEDLISTASSRSMTELQKTDAQQSLDASYNRNVIRLNGQNSGAVDSVSDPSGSDPQIPYRRCVESGKGDQ